ncbi:Flp pilus assembly protein CpaB [Vibrio breoganii]|uniref:Flp pilus assembly protein CpaB n=1 Tax=Vibrio breoganii TaxID=553239 RepID=UPI0002F0EEDB|nr:Flp pilus assembly protein CpaB [Vibrio breoganii]OCH73467.1 Flp pilus assembly protein CpaB [Vibrio breoganii]OED94534.1 Flp pilus assembly protein CpaB [Vibrio breoganii ZF-29]OEF82770.1 Flp pilus assembly protein CpaB [Vibrio breoganii 1C10]PMG99265.1 Flp pilus assembly protein CpaB [Vibrio breoganii]PML12891.1 Flp pilus assembly protein CpaB [Vibrio breoganii]
MSKGTVIFLLILSVVFGLGAVMVAKQWMEGQNQPQVKVETVERHPIVIAAMDIPEGTVIEEKHLTKKQLEVAWQNSNQLKDASGLIGMVSKSDVFQGEIIHKSHFGGPNEGASLAVLIPEDKRAVTIRVNDVVGVAGFLLPGNKVDILNTVNNRTSTVLKDIRVLAVDQTAKTNENKPIIVRAVTLEVSPRQAERLLSENSKGTIQLALRNPQAVDPPVRRYVAPPSVTIIKGTSQSNVRVNN